jgi:hypothetical protein
MDYPKQPLPRNNLNFDPPVTPVFGECVRASIVGVRDIIPRGEHFAQIQKDPVLEFSAPLSGMPH